MAVIRTRPLASGIVAVVRDTPAPQPQAPAYSYVYTCPAGTRAILRCAALGVLGPIGTWVQLFYRPVSGATNLLMYTWTSKTVSPDSTLWEPQIAMNPGDRLVIGVSASSAHYVLSGAEMSIPAAR